MASHLRQLHTRNSSPVLPICLRISRYSTARWRGTVSATLPIIACMNTSFLYTSSLSSSQQLWRRCRRWAGPPLMGGWRCPISGAAPVVGGACEQWPSAGTCSCPSRGCLVRWESDGDPGSPGAGRRTQQLPTTTITTTGMPPQ